MLLPASGDREYNLVAHDGKYGQWRTWANGVLAAVPDQARRGTPRRRAPPDPARDRPRPRDRRRGPPVAGREVRASAADRLENRYYDPTTKTDDDGTL